MKHEGSTFLSGCAPFIGFFFFAKELDELVAADQPNSTFLCFDDEDAAEPFQKFKEAVGWPAISMATIMPEDADRVVVAVGPNGDYWEGEPTSLRETVGMIANFRGNLRALSVVDDVIYAGGMGRVVLQRDGLGKWRSLGPGARKDDPAVTGFEDIGGYSQDEMYAVGWGGEIWWRDRGKWRRVDSPTSRNLRALYCADDENVYVVGHNGTMLRGRRDFWTLMATERQENLMDVASFGDNVYVATDFKLLKLVDDKLVNDTNFADAADLPKTCLYLLRAEDGLISMGTKDLFSCDGGLWKRLV